MSKDHSDKCIPFIKVMTLLDAVPGRADKPEVGDPIAIITMENDGEIESPFMLNMADSRKLAKSLLCILGHHGDDQALRIYEQFGDGIDEAE